MTDAHKSEVELWTRLYWDRLFPSSQAIDVLFRASEEIGRGSFIQIESPLGLQACFLPVNATVADIGKWIDEIHQFEKDKQHG